jgi:drug/metabolite transporter (DMT)-like permease
MAQQRVTHRISKEADMTAKTPAYQRLIAGVGGASLILAVFLPWASVEGVNRTGWELNTVAAVLFLLAGVFGIATAITGGQYGAGRPDLSVIAAADLLNTTSMLLLAWLIFDFPEHTTRQAGVFGALISAAATAFAVADYRPLRGAPWFAPMKSSEPTRAATTR